ncbi:MAG TPA: ABC transporter permease subunit [Dongiaceae bacterium]|nr:ABC transporter permease subunit [Dongiaceae bacterium]
MTTRGERLAMFASGLLLGAVLLVLYAPVAVGALFSVVRLQRGQILWDTASVQAYVHLLDNADILTALGTTALVAAVAVSAATVMALALALYVQSEGAFGRGFLELLVYLPFVMPPIVTGLSLLLFFSGLGLARDIATISIGHGVFVLAILYRTILVRLQSLPPSLAEASADLGATLGQTFRYVTLPYLRSALVTGALLALTLSFDETLITVFLAGDRMTLPLRLWAMMRVGFTPEINALITLVILASIGLAVGVAARLRGAGRLNV